MMYERDEPMVAGQDYMLVDEYSTRSREEMTTQTRDFWLIAFGVTTIIGIFITVTFLGQP